MNENFWTQELSEMLCQQGYLTFQLSKCPSVEKVVADLHASLAAHNLTPGGPTKFDIVDEPGGRQRVTIRVDYLAVPVPRGPCVEDFAGKSANCAFPTE